MKNFKNIGKTVFALAVMISLGGAIATPAHADDWHHDHDREWREHERESREWHHRHFHHGYDRPVVYREPNVVYAPPVILQQPTATVEDSSPGLNITVPINFR